MNEINHILPKILLVDDEPDNLQVLKQVLQNDYRLAFAKDGERGLEVVKTFHPDLILLDVMMPKMDGFETCYQLKQEPETADVPVIFVTAMTEIDDEAQGFRVGAVDYITKPISPAIVRARVKTHLSLVSVQKIQNTRLEIIRRLGRAAEYKDNETGLHVIRMSKYSQQLALAAKMSEEEAERVLHAAPMHDVGKIGIPDNILLKRGQLNADEWAVMRRHPAIGAEIIGRHESPMLEMARLIALTHHEKWDSSGYPRGLAGRDIPLVSRIVAIADVFDALTTKRPYKEAWSVDEALRFMEEQKGRHFDPHLLPLFFEILPKILSIKETWSETLAATKKAG